MPQTPHARRYEKVPTFDHSKHDYWVTRHIHRQGIKRILFVEVAKGTPAGEIRCPEDGCVPEEVEQIIPARRRR